MWKIIRTDRFARESVDDELVCDNISNLVEAETMVAALRVSCTEWSTIWYELVDAKYKLRKFEP